MKVLLLLFLCVTITLSHAFRVYSRKLNFINVRAIGSLRAANSDFERTVTPQETTIEVETAQKPSEDAAAEIKRRELSDTMKQKLRQELISQGADPNYSAGPILGNPILIISFVIGILVLVGGKGYFF